MLWVGGPKFIGINDHLFEILIVVDTGTDIVVVFNEFAESHFLVSGTNFQVVVSLEGFKEFTKDVIFSLFAGFHIRVLTG